MKIADHLSNEQKQQLNKIKSPQNKQQKPKQKKKKQERVNWNEIMGTKNRGLRRKKGGAWTN